MDEYHMGIGVYGMGGLWLDLIIGIGRLSSLDYPF